MRELLKTAFRSLDYTDFKKKTPHISQISQYISYLCNRFIIAEIKDFLAFSEISMKKLDRPFQNLLKEIIQAVISRSRELRSLWLDGESRGRTRRCIRGRNLH